MYILLYAALAVLILGIIFLVLGIRTFAQMRKYYKSLVDFKYYDYGLDGDD